MKKIRRYRVSGMSCAACAARVEKAARGVPGLENPAVNLLAGTLSAEGDFDESALASAVKKAGYAVTENRPTPRWRSEETRRIRNRFFASLGILLPLFYLGMAHGMWGAPLPAALAERPLLIAWIAAALSFAVMAVNFRYFKSGVKGILRLSPNMDTLVSTGSLSAFVYSLTLTVLWTAGVTPSGLTALSFDTAGMILTLINLGKWMESSAKGKAADAVEKLRALSPETATVLRNGTEVEIPAEQLQIGDSLLVRAGQNLPADGTVTAGFGSVDEAALTGESIPVDKAAGNEVRAGTSVTSGTLTVRVTAVREDTLLSEIVRAVEETTAGKAPIARTADRVAGIFVPAVMAISLVTFAVWMLLGAGAGYALERAVSVLVVSCPCALGLATPVAITVGTALGARHGVLFKNAAALEIAGRVDAVALDKTGTLSLGTPRVTDVLPFAGATREQLLETVLLTESESEHPLARAAALFARESGAPERKPDTHETVTGSGVRATFHNTVYSAGKLGFMQTTLNNYEIAESAQKQFSQDGKTVVFFADSEKILGALALFDTPRPEAEDAVAQLHAMGCSVTLLSGDTTAAAAKIGALVGVSDARGNLLPGQKQDALKTLRDNACVAMVGDGMNDAPALAAADLGIAVGGGADIAADAADAVLLGGGMSAVPTALKVGRATLRNVKENLFWAFFYNAVMIPVAAGAFTHLGITLTPMLSAAAMSLSSVSVVLNALRLNFARVCATVPRNFPAQCEILPEKTQPNKENTNMVKTMKIDGMMCHHCEAHVKAALEKIPGVVSAVPDFEKNLAAVTLSCPVDDAVLTAAVEAEDYKVTEIR